MTELRVLKDEEIEKLAEGFDGDAGIVRSLGIYDGATAQFQADIEGIYAWGEEYCYDHHHRSSGLVVRRRECYGCWESLKQLVEEHGS